MLDWIKSTIAGVLLTFLTGCVQMHGQPYAEPEGEPTAKLTIVNSTSILIQPFFYAESEKCENRSWIFGGIYGNGSDSVKISAGSNFSFSIYQTVSGNGRVGSFTYCWDTVTFTPKGGGQYTATYLAAPQGCTISVTESGGGLNRGAQEIPVAVRHRRLAKGFDERGPWCSGDARR